MNTLRKGFTLIELLFVMAIVAILAGFAIANLKDSTKMATLSSVKNDVRNAIAAEQTFFAENQKYDNANGPGTNGTLEGESGAAFSISKGNNLDITLKNCDNGAPGYYIVGKNENYTDNEITFDSCIDGRLQDGSNEEAESE